ncbi:hypothetical protein [Ferrovibrio sp.]|uniref:hypothetical protein n=1 Tax=Ferrovibrio sp. TaxID=1917215 RepID=UPI00311EA6A7
MRWRDWIVLAVIAAAGWSIAGLVALTLLSRVDWPGLALIGLLVLLVASRMEMTEDAPSHLPAPHLLARQTETPRDPEARLARLAERMARHRALYVARTFGLALVMLGGGMTLLHMT